MKIFNSTINNAYFRGIRREFQATYKSDESSSFSSYPPPPAPPRLSGQNMIFRLVVYVYVLFKNCIIQELVIIFVGHLTFLCHLLHTTSVSFVQYFHTIFFYRMF